MNEIHFQSEICELMEKFLSAQIAVDTPTLFKSGF